MEQVMMFATVLLPIVTALVELVKKTVALPKNIIPMISFIIGIIIGAISYPFTTMDLVLRLWAGGFAGLSATGLFEIMNKREGMTKGSNK
ncbi:Phage holin [Paraliobacillus sp. PM-2]|uniref:holin n=1 Tax=Paraliobacillus sp. PM-2 TaxID=1462524 RepID=UPI00061B9672|nr:holin [Paraliobacillus sp. PM-2]CQR48055.1 Phage holin [Paraliobacillus sp. PM-2]